jgi:hypothetical protein
MCLYRLTSLSQRVGYHVGLAAPLPDITNTQSPHYEVFVVLFLDSSLFCHLVLKPHFGSNEIFASISYQSKEIEKVTFLTQEQRSSRSFCVAQYRGHHTLISVPKC